jgi:hypothetical protein
MFFHPHIHTESVTCVLVRAEWKQVRCEQCDCEYGYELIRRAKGEAVTLFHLFQQRAQRAASRRAECKLEKRLARGIDVAPCPQCGWVQREMVRELRGRSTSKLAFVRWLIPCALATSALTLAGAAAARGGGPFPSEVRVMLTAFSAAAAISGALLVAITSRARRRVDPNRDFPAPPQPIPATPRIRASNRAEKALPNFIATCIEPGGWITVQMQGLTFPRICCRCLGATTELHSFPTLHQIRAPVRLCSDCNRVAQRRYRRSLLLMTLLGVVCAVPGLWTDAEPIVRWIAFPFVGGALGYTLGAVLVNRHLNPVTIGKFDSVRNTLRLRFRNPAYLNKLPIQHRPSEIEPSFGYEETPVAACEPPVRGQ